MKVILAGYNIDAEIVAELKQRAGWTDDNVTPETLSAAYARISRDPRDIDILRSLSRTETASARKSNETIIFGLGHASVAEHAVFNLDLIGISRLAAEYFQKYRLASFTEKSQRYITLEGDTVLPAEIRAAGLEQPFFRVIGIQNAAYLKLYESLRVHLFAQYSDMVKTRNGERTVDGWAKEDARYVLSLATASQFGMTVNARTLEHMLRRFRASSLSELTAVGEELYAAVAALSPSIIKYTSPTEWDTETPRILESTVSGYAFGGNDSDAKDECRLVSHTPDPDTVIAASLLFEYGAMGYEASFAKARAMSSEEKENLINASFSHRQSWDRVVRAFENVSFTFDLTVSATNYAQLKRHRMSTQLPQDYLVSNGVTLPPRIAEIGMESVFFDAIAESELFYDQLDRQVPCARNYILTNAHRRRVLLSINLRELYHFSSLREDAHAQWDIRNTAIAMRQLAAAVAPLTTRQMCGKDSFAQKDAEYEK